MTLPLRARSRRHARPSSFLLLVLLAVAGQAAAAPALWRIAHDQGHVYLFGTMHALPAGSPWMDERITAALGETETLLLEHVPTPAAMQAQQALAGEIGRYPAGAGSLSAVLGEARWSELAPLSESLGLPAAALDTLRPWLASLTLNAMLVTSLGLDPANGADAALFAHAESHGIQVTAIEDGGAVMRALAAVDEDEQVRLLQVLLENRPRYRTLIDSIHAAWSGGDMPALDRLMNDDLRRVPQVHDALLLRRNRAWADAIADRLQRDERVMVAVGAGHFVGDGNLLDLLRARGYRPEPVRAVPTP